MLPNPNGQKYLQHLQKGREPGRFELPTSNNTFFNIHFPFGEIAGDEVV